MARMPSMVALLGLLAVAGYQNRDKLGGMLDGLSKGGNPADPNNRESGLEGILGGLGGMLGGATSGSVLSSGLGDLIDRFRQTGRGEKADSWINEGANASLEASDLEEALGDDTIVELTQKTGLSRSELLKRLSDTLPDAVNQLTPDGRLPSEVEASRFG
ncbi:DUF937 domain-containing protein [Mesorhizobium sp. NBSH29]|uniref:YidB family protein n=1 Tax=Mesorhizobium sp. NBSH29 TaxID=2654249 RepID=UPI00189690F5|nr:YidB family protein [Mesorhizobium sp. NBSH29]QPC88508.1 DUF937 domain-containing protein [Mesorhizobium sp. NBSH29]